MQQCVWRCMFAGFHVHAGHWLIPSRHHHFALFSIVRPTRTLRSRASHPWVWMDGVHFKNGKWLCILFVLPRWLSAGPQETVSSPP